MKAKVRAMIVDHEPLARERLAALLDKESDVEVAGEVGSGAAAVVRIPAERPDLVFLDTKLPDIDGFSVLRAIPAEQLPIVIFVTEYDPDSIRAFNVYALDYVMKPVAGRRFHEVVGRALERIRSNEVEQTRGQMTLLLERLHRAGTPEQFAIRSGNDVVFVGVGEIDWIEADGDAARLHVGKDTHRVEQPIADLERRLPPAEFMRIHGSYMVQVDRIQKIQPWFKGDYMITLRDGTQLCSGRAYRQRVLTLLR